APARALAATVCGVRPRAAVLLPDPRAGDRPDRLDLGARDPWPDRQLLRGAGRSPGGLRTEPAARLPRVDRDSARAVSALRLVRPLQARASGEALAALPLNRGRTATATPVTRRGRVRQACPWTSPRSTTRSPRC